MARGYANKRIRLIKKLQARDGDQCFYCRIEFATTTYTLDHWVPRSKGGAHTLGNLRLACKPCNANKADSWPEDINDRVLKTWFIQCRKCNDGRALEVDDICRFCGETGKQRWHRGTGRRVVVSNDIPSMREVRDDARSDRARAS